MASSSTPIERNLIEANATGRRGADAGAGSTQARFGDWDLRSAGAIPATSQNREIED
jgi:hypothetical protein